MKVAFPEFNNPTIFEAIKQVDDVEVIAANNLAEACEIVKSGKADAMIAGIDFSSRDVILACKEHFGISEKTFSSSMIFDKEGEKRYIVADIATCKNPTENQLFDIVCQTHKTAKKVLDEEPKIAMLCFSSFGSGGKDDSMTKIQNVVNKVHELCPEIQIDGEMQLDTAIVPEVAKKKAGKSKIAGSANVLICPDINSGNILYKSLEHFGGFSAAGPILQGFNFPASDLSRGSNLEDVVRTIEVMKRLINN